MASGLNALAHCVDSMWAPRTDPIDQALALEGIRALRRRSAAQSSPTRLELAGREQTLYGAYLSAVAFASAGSGLHHKICHVLGGMFDLPHAETHAIVLPYVLALNAPAVPDLDRPDGRGVRRATRPSAGLQRLRDERRRAARAARPRPGRGRPADGGRGRSLEAAPAEQPDDPVTAPRASRRCSARPGQDDRRSRR